MQAYSTLNEFCQRHRMCRRTFYNLREAGAAPAVIKRGPGRSSPLLISAEAEQAWIAVRIAATLPPCPAPLPPASALLPPAQSGNTPENKG